MMGAKLPRTGYPTEIVVIFSFIHFGMIIALRCLNQIDGKRSNRSQVQGSTFWVKDKEGIKGPEFSLKMPIFPNKIGAKFWIRPDEADAFLVNTYPKCSPGMRMEP
jgi:hypothetical protein